jgi:manganese peroxidase
VQTYTPPGALGSYACAKDTCCVWDYVVKDLIQLFTACDGTCNALARAAIRGGFHDAGAWDLNSSFGGADGSLFLSSDEISRPENNGLQTWRTTLLGLLSKYSQYGVGAADLAQFAHNAAVVICPLGPRTLTYVGRDSSSQSNLPNLLPDTHSSADILISLFQNKSTSFVDLIALIGAHTTANQFFVDTTKAGQPLDSTPGIWDVLFYQEVLNGAPPP